MSRPETDNKIELNSIERRNANLTPGGPGRPKGQKNYATLYREGLLKLAQAEGSTADDIEQEMLANAVKLAKKGDYRFYKDLMDRKYGQAVARSENLNATTNLDKIPEEEKKRLDGLIT